MNTKRIVGIITVATAMLLALTSASPVMAQDVSAVGMIYTDQSLTNCRSLLIIWI